MTQREEFVKAVEEEVVAIMVAGYLVWDETYELAYRSHLYSTLPDAQKALSGIVWHSRDRYAIREVLLGDKPLSSRVPPKGENTDV